MFDPISDALTIGEAEKVCSWLARERATIVAAWEIVGMTPDKAAESIRIHCGITVTTKEVVMAFRKEAD